MSPNKPHHIPADLPLWRTFYLDSEKRWWRCRLSLAGIELGFRASDDRDWSSRVVNRPRGVPSSPNPGDADFRDREIAREDALVALVHQALKLAGEQLAAGFSEESDAAGSQLWALLPTLWRGLDVDRSVAQLVGMQERVNEPALDQVVTWLVNSTGLVKYTNIERGFSSKSTASWWPSMTGIVHAEAISSLRANSDGVVAACVLALVTPGLTVETANIFGDTLLVSQQSTDNAPVFDALFALMTSRRVPLLSLPRVLAHLCAATDARVQRVAATLATTDDELVRERAAFTLAYWSSDHGPFLALLHAAQQRVLTEAVLCAVEVAPRTEWLPELEHSYHRIHASRHSAIDAAISACKIAK